MEVQFGPINSVDQPNCSRNNTSVDMEDKYVHEDETLVYICENIPGPTESTHEFNSLLENFNSQLSNHCECTESCNKPECPCLSSAKVKYTDGRIELDKIDTAINFPIFECNSLCKCNSKCGNRVVQHGPADGLVIKLCNAIAKGLGLFTTKQIPTGTFICEYAGEIITKQQAIKRHQLNSQMSKMNYIFCLNEHCNGSVTRTIIDPSQFGNVGRYINHSCDPNCLVLPVRVDNMLPKLAIFTCAEILPNTEITFDYGTHSMNARLKEEMRKPCLCGAELCRGFMPFDSY